METRPESNKGEKLAFPSHWCDNHSHGMTLRDYMAIHASEWDINQERKALGQECHMSKLRYAHADNMLKARESK